MTRHRDDAAPDEWAMLEQHFAELLDADPPTRDERLRGLEAARPDLAATLRAMLDAHASADDTFLTPAPAARGLTERAADDIANCHGDSHGPGSGHGSDSGPTPDAARNLGLGAASAHGDSAPRDSAPGRTTTPGPVRPDPLIGRSIGPFRIRRRLGAGGMSTVYVATQSHPDRSVALKILRPSLVHASIADRFRVEVDVLSELEHPGIARLIDAGTCTIDGIDTPWLALELVTDARPITDAARDRPRDRQLELFLQAADAVAAAHRRGVIHRDLKPANILVGHDQRVKVIDFGIARILGEHEHRLTLDTPTSVLGTLAYMSPEQFDAPRSADTRSDVYALAVVLHELLTGRLPYPETPRTIAQASAIITQGRIQIDGRALRSRGLVAVLHHALAPDRAARSQSVGALADDVRRVREGLPPSVRASGFVGQLRVLAARHRAAAVATLALLVTLVAATIVSVSLADRATRLAASEAEARAAADRRAALAAHGLAHDALRRHRPQDARAALARIPDSERGWAWRFLDRRLDLSDRVRRLPLRGVRGSIGPGGRRVSMTSSDGHGVSVHVADLDDPDAVPHRLAGPDGIAAYGRFVDADRTIARIEYRQSISLWDAATGTRRAEAPLGAHVTDIAAVDTDGTLVLVTHDQRGVRVRLDPLKVLDPIPLPTPFGTQCTALAVADGVATAVMSGGVVIRFRLGDDTIIDRWNVSGMSVGPAVIARDGRRAAWSTAFGQLVLFDAERGVVLRRTDPLPQSMTPLVYEDGVLVASGPDGALLVVDERTDVPTRRLHGHTSAVVAATAVADGRFTTLGQDGSVRDWSVDRRAGATEFVHITSPCTVLARDAAHLFVASETSIMVFRHADQSMVANWSTPERLVPQRLAVVDDRTLVMTRQTTADLLVLDWRDGSTHTIPRDVRTWDLATHPDWRTVAAARLQSTGTSLIDLESGETERTATPWMVTAVAWLDPHRLVEAGDGGVHVLDRRTGVATPLVGPLPGLIRDVTVSPEGDAIAVGTWEGELVVVDLARGDVLRTNTGAAIQAVTFGPDRQSVVSVGDDRRVQFRHRATLELIMALDGHRAVVNDAIWSPDGGVLYTADGAHGTRHGHVLRWPLQPDRRPPPRMQRSSATTPRRP